jgi:subtilase family serine protease
MKRLGSPLLVLLALLAVALPATAAAKPSPALSEQSLEAIFAIQHPRGLNRFVRAVSDPSSERYRDYASVEALVERFGASQQKRKQVLHWLARRGLRGTVGPTGTFVTAPLPRDRAAALLSPSGGARLSSLVRLDARVPAGLRGAVTGVAVVDTTPETTASLAAAQPRVPLATTKKKGGYSSVLPHSGTAAGCPQGSSGGPGAPFIPFTPNQYLTAYGHSALHGKGLRGQGQTIAVVEIDGFRHSDIVAFDRCFGVKTPPIRTIPVQPLKKPLPPSDETTLDLEMLTVAAPKLDRILVYEGSEAPGGIALTAASALGSPGNRPDVISISLGICEPELSGSLALRGVFDDIFAIAAGAGISTLVSAGDTGSSGCRTDNQKEETTALPVRAVSLPSSSPYVTAVGGTNLELTKQNRIKREIVWNDLPIQPGGGGGGGSIVSPRRPWWQAGIKRYGAGRIVPDIAALADIYPGYAYYCTATPCDDLAGTIPGWKSIGGTSAAAPLMAAGVALANQYAAKRGQPSLGFLNPLLYRLGADGQTRADAFNDVTVGNNDLGKALPPEAGGGRPLGCCPARKGYDWASGWGSLKLPGFAKLASAAGS